MLVEPAALAQKSGSPAKYVLYAMLLVALAVVAWVGTRLH
jgi:hypothetical protein